MAKEKYTDLLKLSALTQQTCSEQFIWKNPLNRIYTNNHIKYKQSLRTKNIDNRNVL